MNNKEMTTNSHRFRDNIEHIKQQSGLNQTQIASLLGISRQAISNLLSDNVTRQPTKIMVNASVLLRVIVDEKELLKVFKNTYSDRSAHERKDKDSAGAGC